MSPSPASAGARDDASRPRLVVAGIGADGWPGLGAAARAALNGARVILGAPRQLDLVRGHVDAELRAWPSPLLPALPGIIDACDPAETVVLASGDPMFHGIGTTLTRLLGADRLRVLPAPSSASLACARLGWALDRTEVVSLVTGRAGAVAAAADRGRPFLVLARSAASAADVAEALADRPDSAITALTDLGAETEAIRRGTAAAPPEPAGDLTVLAVEPAGPRRPWLSDDDFETDGQLTKSPIRELTVAALGPAPGAVLWDVGGGTGSIAVEWSRHGGRAACIERNAERAERIRRNAARLGPVRVVAGTAPADLHLLREAVGAPDAVFIGGGLTADGMVEACLDALAPGGRLVANAVTVESVEVLWRAFRAHGGDVRRIGVDRAGTVGTFTTLRPALPVTQWIVVTHGG
ncbi:precorrin-6y C5,15-methyltransferase (decarboxylating) subunit CbiE [Corynebacterium sp. 335C]